MKIGKIKFSICTLQFAISNITGDVMEAQARSRQWTPRVNGRLACASYAYLTSTCEAHVPPASHNGLLI